MKMLYWLSKISSKYLDAHMCISNIKISPGFIIEKCKKTPSYHMSFVIIKNCVYKNVGIEIF